MSITGKMGLLNMQSEVNKHEWGSCASKNKN